MWGCARCGRARVDRQGGYAGPSLLLILSFHVMRLVAASRDLLAAANIYNPLLFMSMARARVADSVLAVFSHAMSFVPLPRPWPRPWVRPGSVGGRRDIGVGPLSEGHMIHNVGLFGPIHRPRLFCPSSCHVVRPLAVGMAAAMGAAAGLATAFIQALALFGDSSNLICENIS